MWRTVALATLVLVGQANAERAGLVTPGRATRAHRPTVAREVRGWHALVDRDTGVPLRMWGPSLPVFAATADPAIAERAARAFLAAHLATLAPGATPADFVLVANRLDPGGHVRSVGFAQYAGGTPVDGGAIGIVFERDHLVMASSTALPYVRTTGGTRILPLVYGAGEVEYRAVTTVERDGWLIFLDAHDASEVARRSLRSYASATIAFDVPDRYPLATRSARPAPQVTHMIAGVPVTSDAAGLVTFATSPTTIAPGLAGPLVAVVNAAGPLATDDLPLADGATVVWSRATEPQADAQLSALIFASTGKQFVREHLDPALPFLDQTLTVSVNEPDQCNAYSSVSSIHFYQESATCENTGRIADIVYHELGHSIHASSIIPGVGSYDMSLSEGLADTLAVSITGDPGVARGFYYSDAPLRNLAPATPKRWPDDADGEVHDEGEIVGEALYDLRRALEAKYSDGFARFLQIYEGELQRAEDLPSTYLEALVTDDDDGDLSNGVPDQCAIDGAFGAHGLAQPARALNLAPPQVSDHTISVAIPVPTILDPACPPPSIASAALTWHTETDPTTTTLELVLDRDAYAATIPAQPAGTVIRYQVTVTLTDGTRVQYPDNHGDPEYQLYDGPVVALQCFDFEAGAEGWTHGASPAENDEWQVGAPHGLAGDPAVAHGGTSVLGIDLDGDGFYAPSTQQWATSPPIDLHGHTDARLQYFRWLDVQNAPFDKASIKIDDAVLWKNHAVPPTAPLLAQGDSDREWRFHDLALPASAEPISLTFELDSNATFPFGGWTVDDVCVVVPQPPVSDDGCCSASGSANGLLWLVPVAAITLRRRRRRPATHAPRTYETQQPQRGV